MENQMTVELNPNKQYILCGDISMSMAELDPKCGGVSRYAYMLEKFKSFIKESEDYDPDGPTVLLFGEQVHTYRNTTLDKISSKLDNHPLEGFTNTHLVIAEAWRLHQNEKAILKNGGHHPGTVCFVFTDGAPTNKAALERIIVQIANSVGADDEFSIGFVLVGTIHPALREYLDHLDDGLKSKAKYDIVGTTAIDNLTFLKAVNNAINE